MPTMMVETQHDNTSDTAVERLTKKKRQCWRTGGWSPLAYPASSLLQNVAVNSQGKMSVNDNAAAINPFFPLDKDVLRGAVREMLMCEESVDGDSLKLMEQQTRFIQSGTKVFLGPRYTPHVLPGIWTRQKEDEELHIGTDDGDDEVSFRRKKRKLHTLTSSNKKQKTTTELMDDDLEKVKIPARINCAEALVDIIVDRARLCNGVLLEPIIEETLQRPPRKVSDSDGDSDAPVLLDLTDETCGEQDISLFVDMTNRCEEGCVTFLKQEIPAFLDIPIQFESSMKNVAYRMLSQMLETFEDESLGRFLGYKSCNLKRERTLRIISDYLFDVSHAMFAWKQTEGEILSERSGKFTGTAATQVCQELDSMVRDALFDERALKKIGGLDDSSILRHAIEISRCERKKETWERFAKTVTGSRLLFHHRTGRAYLIGLRRRGQRIKRLTSTATVTTASLSTDGSEDGGRSRSSSIASFDEEAEAASNTTTTVRQASPETTTTTSKQQQPATAEQEVVLQQEQDPIAPNLSEVLELTLSRQAGKSWGVLLSREGDMCVVVRGSDSLRCGDLVLSVKSQHGEAASPPSFWSVRDPDWFKNIVSMFKESNELHLSVRRVGC